jgi:hypothetical protein
LRIKRINSGNVDWQEFEAALPRNEKLIFKRLRHLILETEPRLVETKSYGVPYYSRHKRICFIWPVSAPDAPKAKNQKDDGTLVSIGFCYGNQLSNDQNILLSEGRKQVYIVRIKNLRQLERIEPFIVELVHEAFLLDELQIRKKQTVK